MFEYLYYETYFFCALKILFICAFNLGWPAVLLLFVRKKTNEAVYLITGFPVAALAGWLGWVMCWHVPCIHQLTKTVH